MNTDAGREKVGRFVSTCVHLWLRRFGSASCGTLIVTLFSLPTFAFAQSVAMEVTTFDVPAGHLEPALKAFNAQSGVPVIVPAELATGVLVHAVKGTMLPRTALERMLDGTPLSVSAGGSDTAYGLVRRSAVANVALRNASAIVVVGLSADHDQAQRLWEAADGIRYGLRKRGVPDAAITVIPGDRNTKARREAFLAMPHVVKSSVEETWLILLGEAAPGRDGQPAYQVSGPRISTGDIARVVAELPGEKYVVLAMANSGGFLPSLVPLGHVQAVSATAASGESNEPRFPQMWAGALGDAPAAEFRQLATVAAARVEAFYADHALGQGEHAQLIDRASGRIVPVSFNTAPVQATP